MSAKTQKNKDNVKIKNTKITETLSIMLPIVGIFVFLVGGMLLFVYLEEAGKTPNEDYLAAEILVNDGTLIGLTLTECVEVIGSIALIDQNGDWLFMAGYKEPRRASSVYINYEICVSHENGVAVNAVLRKS